MGIPEKTAPSTTRRAETPPAADTAHDSPPAAGGPETLHDRPAPVPRCTETVLVVEDDAAVRGMVALALQRCGYTVFVADTPGRALDVCRGHPGPVDVLVADVLLPGMPGPDLARALLTLRPALRVLYLSGLTREVLAQRGLVGPGDAVLEKPFPLEALAGRLRAVLAG